MELNHIEETKERFNPRSVVLFTPVYYKNWYPGERVKPDIDLVRGDVSLNTFRLAVEAGYQVVLVDGGSSQEYLDELQKLGITPLQQVGKSIASAKREGLQGAWQLEEAKVLVLIQPEKDAVIQQIQNIVEPILLENADIVVVKRNLELFQKTYPGFQFKSEMWANKWCNKIAHMLGLLPYEKDRDWFFGVKALKKDPEIIELFMRKYQILDEDLKKRKQVDTERYSDFDYYPTVEALRQRKKVVFKEVPYEYSKAQKEMEESLQEEFVDKRRMQRTSILAEFVQYVRYMINNPKSRLIQIMEEETKQIATD